MAIVDTLMKLTDWLNDNVCRDVKLKKPTADREAMDENYQYDLVTPVAFPFFVPSKDRLPPRVVTDVPSICVQILDGEDDGINHSREININLGFTAWNPGNHLKDLYFNGPEDKGKEFIQTYFPTVKDRKSGETKLSKFRRTSEGWMDTWNFIDKTIRALEQTDGIDGIQIAKDVPIKFGPFKEQESIPEYYPFWFAWVQFTIRTGVIRHTNYDEFL